MPRAPHYITTPAVIRKADIAITAELSGCVNAYALELNGVQYPPKALQYAVFVGERKRDGLYHGEHRFVKADQTKEHQAADFAPLFNGDESDVI
jgi:hypothetical protein